MSDYNHEFPYKSYEEIQAEKRRRKKMRRGIALFSLCAVAVVAAALAVGVYLSGTPFNLSIGQSIGFISTNPGKVSAKPDLTGGTGEKFTMDVNDLPEDQDILVIANDVTGVVKKAADSVVGISTEIYSNFTSVSSGSGIILSDDGYIVTNAHVISGGDSITVTLNNGNIYPAYLIGSDEFTDIAVIKIEADGLVAAEFGNSDTIEVGATAVAIGNPTGQLQGTVTAGIISAVSRSIWVNNNMMTLIQTDASINSGNSGGPLINKHGQVIGINSAKISATGYEGIGFAIPINTVKPIVEELIENGYISGRPIVGIQVSEVSKMASAFYGIPQGLYVNSLMQGADILKKGVAQGDVITHVGGERVYTLSDAVALRNQHSAGEEIGLTVYRRGKSYNITIKLSEQNQQNSNYNF